MAKPLNTDLDVSAEIASGGSWLMFNIYIDHHNVKGLWSNVNQCSAQVFKGHGAI